MLEYTEGTRMDVSQPTTGLFTLTVQVFTKATGHPQSYHYRLQVYTNFKNYFGEKDSCAHKNGAANLSGGAVVNNGPLVWCSFLGVTIHVCSKPKGSYELKSYLLIPGVLQEIKLERKWLAPLKR